MALTFHQISIDELHTVLNLFKEAAEHIAKMNINHWQYWKNPPAEKLKWVQDGILNNEFFFIKNPETLTIGMVRILNNDKLYWGEQTKPALYVHSLVVKTEFNGSGLGKTIIKHIEGRAKQENINCLRLDADAKNPKLCTYYEQLGFKHVGVVTLPLSTYNLYEKDIE
ncbi:GNAT family N-acetyltransferase [Aestuariibaculum sediminum]|uniref:GNAT family N-acetyltransferase n=1 Tax=Aestuariibaculum sediminum TaxID=2770637 RepID=A0A8J6Q0M7_9FLAO|nr:GNAT family N-acetyltransferase [Aestuariibaculum sediminum]MBD0830621.1 GNAT family N-acetyltransferase [Aestuariibaculum sediminum]